MENRNGLVVDARLTRATGTAESEAQIDIIIYPMITIQTGRCNTPCKRFSPRTACWPTRSKSCRPTEPPCLRLLRQIHAPASTIQLVRLCKFRGRNIIFGLSTAIHYRDFEPKVRGINAAGLFTHDDIAILAHGIQGSKASCYPAITCQS